MIKKLKKLMIVTSVVMLTGITLSTDVRADQQYGDFSYSINSDNSTVTITGYSGKDTEVTFPDTIDEKNVTAIQNSYFWSVFGISGSTQIKVTIPDTVETIGMDAFKDCNNLVNVKLPSKLKTIGDSAFSGCNSIIKLDLPDTVSSIGTYAFQNCSSLKSIEIGGKVPAIMDYAFQGCTNLKNVKLNDGVQIIKSNAFWNCTSLKSIVIPDSVESIGKNAFGSDDAGIQIICSADSVAVEYATDNKYDYVINGTDKVIHGNIQHVDAKKATGISEGNIEYYKCVNCDKYFSDEAGTDEISKDSVVIKKHNIKYVDEKEPTALEDGYKSHYECTDEGCNTYFSDEDGWVEIDKDSVIIPKHILTRVEAKEATFASEGNIEYYKCSGCDKLFKDADGTERTFDYEIDLSKHDLDEHVEAKEPTANTDGNKEYYICSCGKWYYDEEATQPVVNKKDVIIYRHNLIYVEAKEPTALGDGNIGYYKCIDTDCQKYFMDADGTKEIRDKDSVIIKKHKLNRIEAKDATISENGNIEYYECADCHEYFLDEYGMYKVNDKTSVFIKRHILQKVEAKEPTVSEDGNIEYYECTSGCGKYYMDAEGKIEITDKSKVIIAKHVLQKMEAKAATDTEDGNIEYYICNSGCGKYYYDAEGKQEIEDKASVIIPKHVLQKVEAKDATTEEEGNIEYYVCTECDRYYKDAEGEEEITDKTSVIIPKKEIDTVVTLDKSNVSSVVGGKISLKATVTGTDDTVTVKWTSSDKKIATVSSKGVITAKKAGTVVITVTTSNGKSATCKLTVKPAPKKISFAKTKITLKKGKTTKLKYTITKKTYTTVTFSSSNKKVVSVDKNGKIKALKKGTATITVKTANGKKATCKVTVK